MNRLDNTTRTAVIGSLVEGNSIASTCRITGVAKMTVLKLLADVGQACANLHNRWFRDLAVQRVQVDEIWSFVRMKQKHITADKRNIFGHGDVYTFVALDADNKLVISWLVGSRNQTSAVEFIRDLKSRLTTRVQLTTDGYKPYSLAVQGSFGSNVDYAQVVKIYGSPSKEETRKYSPSKFITEEIHKLIGNPDDDHISTSFVERNNLTIRMTNRRMTRLTNAFSKKVENHAHQLAINFFHYNFCRIHQTLRCTPAMAAGLTSHVWNVADLVTLTNKHEAMSSWNLLAMLPPHRHLLQPEEPN